MDSTGSCLRWVKSLGTASDVSGYRSNSWDGSKQAKLLLSPDIHLHTSAPQGCTGGEALLRALEGQHLARGPRSASPRSCAGRRWGTLRQGAGTVTLPGSATSCPRCPTAGGPVPHQVAEHPRLGTDRAARGSRQAGAPCFGVGSDGAASGRALPTA